MKKVVFAGAFAISLTLLLGSAQQAQAMEVIFNPPLPPDQVQGRAVDCVVSANDFEVQTTSALTDVHFFTAETGPWDGTLEWLLFLDDGTGQPSSTPLASGNGINVQKMPTGNIVAGFAPEFEYWFDLDFPVTVSSGFTYWLGLHLSTGFPFLCDIFWETSSNSFGGPVKFTSLGSPGDFSLWLDSTLTPEGAFLLTGVEGGVGGEILSIETTALLLAGVQTNLAWIIPIAASAAGIGLVLVRKKF